MQNEGQMVHCLFLSSGNLNNGADAGSAYLNANNALGNANWNIAGRKSGKFPDHLPRW